MLLKISDNIAGSLQRHPCTRPIGVERLSHTLQRYFAAAVEKEVGRFYNLTLCQLGTLEVGFDPKLPQHYMFYFEAAMAFNRLDANKVAGAVLVIPASPPRFI